jgi:uncharacterized protein (TIGR03000 family)
VVPYEVKPGESKPPAKMPEEIKKPKTDGKTAIDAPATIIVSLPADAKLMVDDTITRSTTATRYFASPVLESGKEFHYTLKAEIVRDGKTYTAVRRVPVRAGEETRITLEFPEESLAQQ